MSHKQLWKLLHRVADGTVSESEHQQLEALLLADSGARRIYSRFMLMESELAFELGNIETFQANAESQYKEPRKDANDSGHWRLMISIAATILIVCLSSWWVFQEDVPRAIEIQGPVTLVSHRQTVPIAGQEITTNTKLTTGEGGYVVLQYRDGTQLKLQEESSIQFRQSKQLFMTQGTLQATVATQSIWSPLTIETQHATIEVLGTKLTAAVEQEATRVELVEGELEVIRKSDQQAVQLAAGNYVVADNTTEEFQAVKLPSSLGEPDFEIHHPDDALAFSPTEPILVAVERANLNLWKSDLSEQIGSFQEHQLKALALSFSADGRYLASGMGDPFVILWDMQKKILSRKIGVGRAGVALLALSSDGGELAVFQEHQQQSATVVIRRWNMQKEEELPPFKVNTPRVTALCYSPDGQQLAIGTSDSKVLIWDQQKEQVIAETKFEYHRICDLAYSHDGKQLVACFHKNLLLILTPNSLEVVRQWEEIGRSFNRMRLSPDNQLIAVATNSGIVRLFDFQTLEQVGIAPVDQTKGVRSITFSLDGRKIAASSGHRIAVWNLQELNP